MAKGNWHDRYKPSVRCRRCGFVIKRKADIKRIAEVPYCPTCYDIKQKENGRAQG